MSADEVQSLVYVDIQHDAMAVFDDVEQAVVMAEDIYVSAYRAGSSSVHGKVKVSQRDGGGSDLVSRDGVRLERVSKTTFDLSVPGLKVDRLPIRFPRQVLNPAYKRSTSVDAPLHINSLALNPKTSHMVVGGPDGYCAVLPTALDSEEKEVQLKGHVGDVRDVKWFPSGEVILTASSDLSIRIYGRDGINPRTLRGHTRAITAVHILGIGKQILSASKDGTVRLWDVGPGREARKWMIGDTARRGVEGMVVLDQADQLAVLGVVDEERVMLLNVREGVWVQPWQGEGWFVSTAETGQLVSLAHETGIVALGYTNGVVEIREVSSFAKPTSGEENVQYKEGSQSIKTIKIRRNEASMYSLALTKSASSEEQKLSLYMGTAAGLPCRLSVTPTATGFDVVVEEELAGWDAVGVECWGLIDGKAGVWCAGGEGGVRRY
ncbi:hypothetical protein IAU60_001992 [Kwoniella sp. DSM 27419]